jgi:hypothetical protein
MNRPSIVTRQRSSIHSPRAATTGVALLLVCFTVLLLAAAALGQSASEDEGYDPISRRGMEQIDRLNGALHQAGRIFVWVAVALLLLVAWKIISPFRTYDTLRDRFLKRAVRDVDELIKRIEAEAEAASGEAQEEPATEGLLAGLTEVAEFSNAEQVPSYVLTVNDLMLDNIRTTLRKLRRFTEGNAPRYRDYLFSVIKGIKTITEQSAEGGVASGLAVDVGEYFAEEKRYKAWRKLLGRCAKRGQYSETAQAFLLFMRNVREGKPIVAPRAAIISGPEAAVLAVGEQAPSIPGVLNEETLPALQQAAAREAECLCTLVRTGQPPGDTDAWQFEFVRRQQQIRSRDEAQRMLAVFLSCERKALQDITKIRMLPCRTWEHVLHLLGVDSGAQLLQRAEDRLLTVQEIIVLEKAFLQTFAKSQSLGRVYGQGQSAGFMMDLHLPQIRRETLALLRAQHQTEPARLDEATEALNDEETPQHGEVKKLIQHYVHHRHEPPSMEEKRAMG